MSILIRLSQRMGTNTNSVSVKSDLLARNYKQYIRMSIITQIFSIPRKHVLGLETIGYTLLSIPEDILPLYHSIYLQVSLEELPNSGSFLVKEMTSLEDRRVWSFAINCIGNWHTRTSISYNLVFFP